MKKWCAVVRYVEKQQGSRFHELYFQAKDRDTALHLVKEGLLATDGEILRLMERKI